MILLEKWITIILVDAKVWAAFITGGLALLGSIYSVFKASRIEHLKAELRKIEKLELDLIERRIERYGKIWKLTGSLNLFGPISDVNIYNLSTQLKEWYFKYGMVLKKDSKKLYFLVQEILNFGMLQSASFMRPDDKELYGHNKRPLDVLREIRSNWPVNKKRFQVGYLEDCVNIWKVNYNSDHNGQENWNWALLQMMMSKFRSGLMKDLKINVER